MGLIFVLGLGIFLFPNVSNIYAEFNQARVVWDYKKEQQKMAEQQREIELEKLNAYNQALESGTITYVDPFEEENQAGTIVSTDNEIEEVAENWMDKPIGHIEIPKIDIDIPIYNGTSDRVLQRGIGLLDGSSMPVGGNGTHAALTGHRGLPQAELFTDLVDLVIGDVFYLHSVAGTLAYKIEEIQTVLPHETESLAIQAGKDLVTLITCTPYMINTHRILLTAVRIPYVALAEETQPPRTTARRLIQHAAENEQDIWLYIVGFVLLVGLVILSARQLNKWRKRRVQ